MPRKCLTIGLLLVLAGCTKPSADNAAAPQAVPSGNALEQVAQLNPAQLDMVLFRAIRDAAQDCQDVTKTERMADEDSRRVWRVTCHGGGQFAVRIGSDGIADVTAPRATRR